MTVAELVSALQGMDQSLPVVTSNHDEQDRVSEVNYAAIRGDGELSVVVIS